jgi:recombination protein RecR
MASIENLKNIFRNFPTVGPRTAGRFVYYLAKLPKEKIDELIIAITDLKNKVKLCQQCFNPFESELALCPICQNPGRDKKLLCIVEKEADLLAIENTKKYNGLYFILGGTVTTMKTEENSHLRIDPLKNLLKNNGFTEIIIAINATPEGKATMNLVEKTIKEINPSYKITHLARGIPVGGELEYADEETLESAIDGRK